MDSLVSQYLDFAERQARHHKIMYMADWKFKLDAFLQVNDEAILTHAGKVSAEIAKELALTEYVKFDEHRCRGEVQEAEDELRNALQKVLIDREAKESQEDEYPS